MYYDAHTHLNSEQLYPNRKKHLEDFASIGGKGLVSIGVNHQYNQWGLAIAKEAEKLSGFSTMIVKATIGLHPCEVGSKQITANNYIRMFEQMKALYQPHKKHIVAIGEIGIDTYYPGSEETLSVQKKLFDRQCAFAREQGLPIVIHSRANFSATIEVLDQYKDLTIYFHCRGYDDKEIKRVLNEFTNVYIGFCGNVSYKKAANIRRSLMTVWKKSPQSVLIETDAPYLSPQVVRKEQNVPKFIPHIYQFIAKELGITEQLLQKTAADNFMRLYTI